MSRSRATIPEDSLTRHLAWVRRLAGRLADDPNQADDLAQTACVTAIKTPPTRDTNVRGWYERVLRNLLRQDRRAEARRRKRERRAARRGTAPSPAELVARLETDRRLVEAVRQLAEPYRTVIFLRFFEDLPAREIARLRQAPVATVHSQIQRGLRRLREMLDQDHDGQRKAWAVPLAAWVESSTRWPLLAAGVCAMKTKAFWLLAVASLLGLFAITQIEWTSPTPPAPHAPPGEQPVVADLEQPASSPAESAATRHEVAVTPDTVTLAADVPRFTGKVVDPHGTPLAGVAVRWRRGDGAVSAETDADGLFALPVPDRDRQVVVAEDRLATVLAAHVGAFVESYVGQPIVVAATAIEVGGRVADERGAPVEHAVVTCVLPEDLWARLGLTLEASHPEPWNSMTDLGGEFHLGRIAGVEGARIVVRKQGYLPVELPQPQQSTEDLQVVLRRPQPAADSVQGQVLDPAGLPLPGAIVSLGRAEAVADGSGLFVLPLQRSFGRRDLHALKPGYLPAVHDLSEMPDPGDFVYLKMQGRTRSIAGTVVDHAGAPVEGARVWVDGAAGFMIEGTIGTLEGYLAGRPTRSALRQRIEGEATRESMDALWHGNSNALWGWVVTDSTGRFELPGLLDQAYRIGAVRTDTLALTVAGPFAAGTTDARLAFPVAAVLERVAGRVVAPDGSPVPGVLITPRLWPSLVHYTDERADFITGVPVGAPQQRTDDEGRFQFRNLGRRVQLDVRGDAILSVTYGDDENDLAALGQPVDELRIEVSRRLRLRIELVDANKADAFEARDGNGERVLLHKFSGSFTGRLGRLAIADGRSEVCSVSESTREIVFYRGDAEVGRTAVELSLGEVNVVRW